MLYFYCHYDKAQFKTKRKQQGVNEMAKYNVTMKCGHVEEHVLFGKHSGRESRMEWLSREVLCKTCQAKQSEEVRNEAKQKNSELGFVVLSQGSTKQIAWAEDIRNQAYNNLKSQIGFDRLDDEKKPHIEACIINAVNANPGAMWWINNRDSVVTKLAAIARDYMTKT